MSKKNRDYDIVTKTEHRYDEAPDKTQVQIDRENDEALQQANQNTKKWTKKHEEWKKGT